MYARKLSMRRTHCSCVNVLNVIIYFECLNFRSDSKCTIDFFSIFYPCANIARQALIEFANPPMTIAYQMV